MTFAPIEILFFFDVVTAVIGIGILLFFVKIPTLEKAESATDWKKVEYFHDLKEGMKYINPHRYILYLIILSGVAVFSMPPMGFLGFLQVSRNFGNDVWRLSAIEVSYSAGMLAGGV